MTGDRIEKQIVLQAPRWKVWQALTDATQFAAWFGGWWKANSPPARHLNERGWAAQLTAIERYVG